MATLTVTMSQLSPNVKAVHTGINVAASALSLSSTFTPSNILWMVKIPNHATIVDYWLKIQTGGAAQTVAIGTASSPTGIMAATSLSQTYSISVSNQLITPTPYGIFNQGWLRAPGPGDTMPVRISLSDDASPSSVWVQGKLTVAISNSAYFSFALFYTMDGMLGHTTIR